jgi:hypothetical protein
MKNSAAVQIASTFNCSPILPSVQWALNDAQIAGEVRITPPSHLADHMLAPSSDSEDIVGTVVAVRIEDWLREYVGTSVEPLSDSAARVELRRNMDEFLNHLAILALRGRPVWILTCPSNGWVAEHYKLATLCRTIANLFAARVRNLTQVEVLTWPSSLSSEDIYDRDRDRTDHSPFTQSAYDKLGESIGQQLKQIQFSRDRNTSSATGAGSPELAAFLADLKVKVAVARATPADRADVDRILRTAASFALAGQRLTISEVEVDALITSGNCLVVSVADRTANYGVSGVAVARSEGDALVVDTMSLSCTVLGKQVEFALLSALAQIAANRRLAKVVFEYHDSGRNQPALAYLKSVATEETTDRFGLAASEADVRVQATSTAPGAWSLKNNDVDGRN